MRVFPRLLSVLALALFMPQVASAQKPGVFGEALGGLKRIADPSGISTTRPVVGFVGTMINTALGVLGVIALGLILYAGGLWLTAAGNDEKVTDAKKIIRTTVIGIAIVALAYAITAFIISLVVSPA